MRLLISDDAKEKLSIAMAETGLVHPVACLGLVSGGSRAPISSDEGCKSVPIEPHWGVGFYEAESLLPEEVVVVCGLRFVNDETLDGKFLDYILGCFHVR